MDEIDRELVERYRESKLADGEELERRIAVGERLVDALGQPVRPLSDRSIDMTLALLSRILRRVVSHGAIPKRSPPP